MKLSLLAVGAALSFCRHIIAGGDALRLYFTHKGTEKLFEGRLPEDGVELAERISGDTTIGHSLAYCQALESLTRTELPSRARYLRVILLEMERLYNHIADFGAIANDTGFAIANAHCLRLRERLLRLNKSLTGNRLLRGGVVSLRSRVKEVGLPTLSGLTYSSRAASRENLSCRSI